MYHDITLAYIHMDVLSVTVNKVREHSNRWQGKLDEGKAAAVPCSEAEVQK